jgi:hypothetical protein
MRDAGYNAALGYNIPDFAHYKNKTGMNCEIWLTNSEAQFWQNTARAISIEATIECYLFRVRKPEDEEGLWYDECEAALNALADNKLERVRAAEVYWDNKIVPTDFASPLKRWNNSSEYAPGFLVARIDLPISYMTNIQ